MSCCCTKTFKICQPVNTCVGSALHINYEAAPGQYVFQLEFLNAFINKDVEVNNDGIVRIATEDLNENYTYTGRLLDLNGNALSLTDDSIQYDCVQFTTKMIIGSQINFTDAGNIGTYSYIFEADGDFQLQQTAGQTLDYITFVGPSISVRIGTTPGGNELAERDTDGQPILLMHQSESTETIYVTGVPAGTIVKIKKS